ncbi:MAG: hypothetical protein IJI60_03545 [Bacilli bacterium]|nr:hypothetical protein [Bacilli bacterium]
MKIWKKNTTDYYIYDYTPEISKKEIFQKIQKKLNLKGFYRVMVTKKKIGNFMQLILIENSLYRDTLDLKIEEDETCEIYYCTEDYFLIHKSSSILFFENKYYVPVEDLDFVIEKLEFGEFVFSSSIEDILRKAVILK